MQRQFIWWAALVATTAAVVGCTAHDTNGDTTTTSAGTATSAETTSPTGEAVVQVFFLDEDAFNIGRPPYVTPVERRVDADAVEPGALDALFAGPTPEEGASGLRFVASEATGYTNLRIAGGTAHVQLTGGCSSGGSTFTIADEIVATLTQFSEVDAVKIYDPEGNTEAPDEPGNSIPFCLEP